MGLFNNPFNLSGAFKGAIKAFGALIDAARMTQPSRNEMRLDSAAWAAKQKLGKSFFTRRLNPKTRAKRIKQLSKTEHAIAKHLGWI